MHATIRDLLNLLFRYARYLILFTVVVILAAAFYYYEASRVYVSKAKLLVGLGTEEMGKMHYFNRSNLLLTQREQQLHNEIEILKSNEVLTAVAEKILAMPGQATTGVDEPTRHLIQARRFLTGEEPERSFLRKVYQYLLTLYRDLFEEKGNQLTKLLAVKDNLDNDLDARALYETDTLELTYRARNPEVAQTVLELIIDEYIKHHIDVFRSNKELAMLESEMALSLRNYEDLLNDFSLFMKQHQIYNNDYQVNLLIEKKNKLQQSLIDTIAEHEHTVKKLARLEEIKLSLAAYEKYMTVEVRNRHFDTLRSKLSEAELERQSLLTRYQPDSRFVKDQQAQIDLIKQLLALEPERLVDQMDQRKKKAFEQLETDEITLDSEIKGSKARLDSLTGQLRDIATELDNYALNLKQFSLLKMNLDFAKKKSERLFEGFLENKIKSLTEQRQITNISLMDNPSLDLIPISPRKKTILALTILIILAGISSLLILGNLFGNTITNPSEIAREFNLPLLGTVPYTHALTKVLNRHRPREMMEANRKEFGKLYSNLTLEAGSPKVIMLAKSRPVEGATTVGLVLAQFMVKYFNKKVALIDYTDDVLFQDLSFSDSDDPDFRTGQTSGVTIFKYHKQPGEMDDLLGGKYRLIESLRNHYDHILLNIPVVRETPDLITLKDLIDMTLFFIEAEKTRKQVARYNLGIMREYGFQKIFMLLNKRKFHIPGWIFKHV